MLRGCLVAKSGFEFGAGDGGGATLHNHDAACVVGEMRCFKVGSARGDGEREYCNDGVARACYVNGRIGAVNRNMARAMIAP